MLFVSSLDVDTVLNQVLFKTPLFVCTRADEKGLQKKVAVPSNVTHDRLFPLNATLGLCNFAATEHWTKKQTNKQTKQQQQQRPHVFELHAILRKCTA